MSHPFTFIKIRAWPYFVHWPLWMFNLDEMRMKTAVTPFTLDESSAMHIQIVKCKFALIILVQGHECFYNLQHKDYDNNLVKDSFWKEIAGELHAQDKELSRRTQRCRRMAG
jgi:hypothetical protein